MSQATENDATAPAAASRGGLVFMAQAAFWFAVMALCVKQAGAHGVPTMQTVLLRALVTLTLSSVGLWRARLSPFGTQTRLLLSRGLFGSGGLVCFYLAVDNLPLAEATVIHQVSPVLTALVAALWLGERLDRRVLLGMVFAFGGVVALKQPTALLGLSEAPVELPWRWVLVGVLGALFASLAYAAVRKLGRSEPALRVVFYFPIVTVPLSAPFAIHDWVWPDAVTWLWLLGVGVSTQIAQVAMTKGLAREPAGRAISVSYLQVVFATVFGGVFFATWPGPWSLCGIALITLGLFVAASRPRAALR